MTTTRADDRRANAAGIVTRQFLSFTTVGAVGFATDAGLFTLLIYHGWSIAGARLVSASSAIVVTWWLNRAITFARFKSAAAATELLRYTGVQVGGLIVNLGAFALCLWVAQPLRAVPVIALAIGGAAALLFNFCAARQLAFKVTRGP
jgi:putative flippase GtrA